MTIALVIHISDKAVMVLLLTMLTASLGFTTSFANACRVTEAGKADSRRALSASVALLAVDVGIILTLTNAVVLEGTR